MRTMIAAGMASALVIGALTVTAAASPEVDTSEAGLPVFAPDEPLLLTARLTGAGGGILIRRPDGTGVWQLATDVLPGVHKSASWSPEGQRVVFIDQESERMWIAHLDGSPTTGVPVCDTPGCDNPAWSPDGTRIAFSRYEGKSGWEGPGPWAVGVYVVDLASGDVSAVVRLERPLLAEVPRWSPDGTQLVIGVDRMDDEAWETGAAVAIVPATGGEPRYLTEFELYGYAPDWSWTTDTIVFGTSIRDLAEGYDQASETSDVWVIQPDGTGLRNVTEAVVGQHFRGPVWTPDGSGISAWHQQLPGSVLLDPVTGRAAPFAIPTDEVRPKVRPLP